MAWTKVVRKLNEFGDDVEAEIEFCWGRRSSLYNTDKAVVFLNRLKEALTNNNLSALADAFNITAKHADCLSQYVALMNFLWHWDVLREAKWKK